MKILHYVIALPVFAFTVWFIYTAEAEEGISFAPWVTEHFNTKLILSLCVVFGYICGRISAWFSYHHIRRNLRIEKKNNRALNKEQTKLNETVKGLKDNIADLQEHAKKQENLAVSPINSETRGWINKITQKFPNKKG